MSHNRSFNHAAEKNRPEINREFKFQIGVYATGVNDSSPGI